jgi:hypothetical protein
MVVRFFHSNKMFFQKYHDLFPTHKLNTSKISVLASCVMLVDFLYAVCLYFLQAAFKLLSLSSDYFHNIFEARCGTLLLKLYISIRLLVKMVSVLLVSFMFARLRTTS